MKTVELQQHSVSADAVPNPSGRLEPLGPRTWQDITVCHVLPEGRRLDPRAFTRQLLPAVALGLHATLASPSDQEGTVHQVKCITLPRYRSRVCRILLSPATAFSVRRTLADLYHVHDVMMLPAALVLKLVFRRKVVYDTREDYPAMMLNKSYIPRPLRRIVGRMVHAAERVAASCCDGFVTADAGSLRPLAKTGNSKKLVFYNLPSLTFFPEPKPVVKRYDLVYRGGLSERAGTFVLLEALRRLVEQGRRVTLLMFGYVDNQEAQRQLHERIRVLNLESNVELRGTIKHDEMAKTLSQARISVCPLLASPKFMHNIPVKVFESWACGLPVVSSDLPPIRPFFNGSAYGLLVKPGDAHDLAKAIEQLLKNPEEAERMGLQARQAVVNRYNSQKEVNKLLSFYQRVLTVKPGNQPRYASRRANGGETPSQL